MSWGGAQWIVIFMFGIRAVLGLGAAVGLINLQLKTPITGAEKFGAYLGSRTADGMLIAVLIWGGFWV
ncbi:hypothetical protein ABIB96_001264 [Bradyrhizobium sp. LA3.X]